MHEGLKKRPKECKWHRNYNMTLITLISTKIVYIFIVEHMLNDCNEEQIEQYGIFWCLCASTTKDYFYQMQVLLTLMFWMYAKFEFNSMTQWWITYLSSICKKNT